ncbi:hypothetical protein HPB47_025082 [Ixodes persulcatus]|uniref:Uncharacterized protein n=1 Tax=Ixodes persulcatus TaxID=34615 RepID=A0AC60Q4J5_IXOPE|nr:hypothetical protein HPB47_025082 [Ixodes persulcatus]
MDRMKRTRAVVRSAVTRTLNMLTDLLRGPDPDSTDLQVHLDFLLQKEAQLKDLDKQISDLVDDEGLENEVAGTLEYNMNISHTVTRVRCALARNHIASDPSQVTDNATVIGDQGQVSAGAGGLSSHTRSTNTAYRRSTEAANTSFFGEPPGLARVLGSFSSDDSRQLVLKRVLMRSLPNDLAILFRLNLKERESPNDSGNYQTGSSIPDTTEVATILKFLRIQIESREESQGGSQWSSSVPPQEDRRGTRPSIAHPSSPSALALPTAPDRTSLRSANHVETRTEETPITTTLVRVLLNTGSQRTFIKRDTAERLQCEVLGTEELTVYTFGNTRHPTNYRCRRVSLTLQSQYSTSKVTMEALEVPDLCTVRTPRLDNDILNQLHSEGLIVADVAPPSLQADTEISVLVGSDLYWKVVTGQIRSGHGLFAADLELDLLRSASAAGGSCQQAARDTSQYMLASALYKHQDGGAHSNIGEQSADPKHRSFSGEVHTSARPEVWTSSKRSTLLPVESKATRSNRFPPVNCTKEFCPSKWRGSTTRPQSLAKCTAADKIGNGYGKKGHFPPERVLRCHSLPRAAHFSTAPTTASKSRSRHGPQHTSSEHVERKLALYNPGILGSIPTPARFDLDEHRTGLTQSSTDWPVEETRNQLTILPETVASSSTISPVTTSNNTSPLLELSNYGSLSRVIHFTAWIRRFMNNALTGFASSKPKPFHLKSQRYKRIDPCLPAQASVVYFLQDYTSGLQIQWRFNVERAPWWGGWWERVIRSVKDCLKRCLGRNSLSYEELTTVPLQVEAALNSRPLTYLSSEPDDLQALTPSHFLLGKRAISLPLEVEPTSLSSTPVDLRRRAQVWKRTLEHLWKRWRKEYLLQLRSAHISTTTSPPRLQIGDVVIVEDGNTPPLLWKLGRVTTTFPGRDGVTRACALRLSNGSQLRRPVQRLYLLEAGTPSATPPGGGC